MQAIDYAVLIGYFLVIIGIGIYSSLRIKKQEDFFMGGRSFGKLLQTFAAFGAGTGSADPVNTASKTFTSGMSGMWGVMYWLFVTPFYWITAVWYRRMRHLTLGDWFVERYESRALGAGYCFFGLLFYIVYGAMLFAAVGQVATPLIDAETFLLFGKEYPIQYLIVPIVGVVVLLYGILGGLRAAYFTDLIQGVCIILLSIILIPYGLQLLVETFGDPETHGTLHGFKIMHDRLPKEHFSIVGSSTSEFPLYRIVAVVLINLVGIVVQPHFIATGGGSAKTEDNARVGLVVGNFLKRFCTVGWVLTALIVLALFAGRPDAIADKNQAWGVATKEILGPLNLGLVGLMLACLLAALMSSVDAYMIVGSGLVVRNIYSPYINPKASEKQYLWIARLTGVFLVGGSVAFALIMENDVFGLLELTWIVGVLFAAPFWIGMYWRRATTTAAWATIGFSAAVFFIIPFLAPRLVPSLRDNESFLTTNEQFQITVTREASPSDVARENAKIADEIAAWKKEKEEIDKIEDEAEQQAKLKTLGKNPAIQEGDEIESVSTTGGVGVFWSGGVVPVDEDDNVLKDVKPQPVGDPEQVDENTTQVMMRYDDDVRLKGQGNFQLDFLLYKLAGMDLSQKTNAWLDTLKLPPKIFSPFLVMILVSLFTKPNSKDALNRYYVKMKVVVDPDHEQDARNLEAAYKTPEEFESKKLFPNSSLEFQKPTVRDIAGFVISVLVCFGIIGLAVLVANIGS